MKCRNKSGRYILYDITFFPKNKFEILVIFEYLAQILKFLINAMAAIFFLRSLL